MRDGRNFLNKSILRLLTAAILFAVFIPSAGAAGANTYVVDEMDMSVQIPSDLIVFTRDISADDTNLASSGFTKDELLSIMESEGSYLDALEPDDIDYQICFTMIESTEADFNQLDDNMLQMIGEALKSGFESRGFTIIKSEIFEHPQTKFIKIYQSMPYGDATEFEIKYYTVYAGKAICIVLHLFTGEITSAHEAVLKSIVDSAKFGLSVQSTDPGQAASQNAAAQTNALDLSVFSVEGLALGFLFTFVIYTLPILIYRYGIKKAPVAKSTAALGVIGYAVVAFGVMSLLIFGIDGSGTAGGSILLWSYINYKILTGGASPQSSDSQYSDGTSSHTVLNDGPEVMPPSDGGDTFTRFDSTAPLSTCNSSIRFCRKCGFELLPESTFCSKCGAPVMEEKRK
ncbi:MAG: zinc ribbon domain-containing protein [Synergistaceae bacterium]|nr:zinc ribbon domain-containing protein [Synergistaceae bacterium]